jgi:energy-coupling factor transporter ATP-binding protein EcfA2
MQLKKIKFSRFKGEIGEWNIEGRPQDDKFDQWLELNNMNLITGKNASGKSRTIEVIRQIAALFSGDTELSRLTLLGYGTAEYEMLFCEDASEIQYFLSFQDGKVIQEIIIEDGKKRLNRSESRLWYEGVKDFLEFEVDPDVLAISKRDKKQHSFFEKLYTWGDRLNFYRFGGDLGKRTFLNDIDIVSSLNEQDIDLKNEDEVTGIFFKAKNKFPESFVQAVVDDMNFIEYHLSAVEIEKLRFPISAYGLVAYESDLGHPTDQREMSQGMFRALSLLIQLNYVILERVPSCILIDDIGEGLDFQRSQQLITLILNKFKDSQIQIIMTTNDRFVMNKVPLEYWQAIHRVPKRSLFYNYQNSREIFEEYKYSGLSNFDFLATGFYSTGFQKEE